MTSEERLKKIATMLIKYSPSSIQDICVDTLPETEDDDIQGLTFRDGDSFTLQVRTDEEQDLTLVHEWIEMIGDDFFTGIGYELQEDANLYREKEIFIDNVASLILGLLKETK